MANNVPHYTHSALYANNIPNTQSDVLRLQYHVSGMFTKRQASHERQPGRPTNLQNLPTIVIFQMNGFIWQCPGTEEKPEAGWGILC
jgi:hypothetical protein